jgi:vacuolar-type H+-ATPase subunit C/Vma6
LKEENSNNLTFVFQQAMQHIDLRNIKQLFRTYRDTFLGPELIDALIQDNANLTRKTAEDLGAKMIDAHLIVNHQNLKEGVKDNKKCMVGLTLKGNKKELVFI